MESDWFSHWDLSWRFILKAWLVTALYRLKWLEMLCAFALSKLFCRHLFILPFTYTHFILWKAILQLKYIPEITFGGLTLLILLYSIIVWVGLFEEPNKVLDLNVLGLKILIERLDLFAKWREVHLLVWRYVCGNYYFVIAEWLTNELLLIVNWNLIIKLWG